MEIKINLDSATPRHLGALIAAMVAAGSLTPDALADVVAPWAMPAGADCPAPGVIVSRETDLRDISIGKLLRFFNEHHKSLTNDELHTLIADLNNELYSRRIPHDDNPASGVEAAALNSDAPAGVALARDLIRKEIIEPMAAAMDDTLDVAKIFAKASDTAHATQVNLVASKEDAAMLALGTPTVTLDKNNLPWDARIHAASKAVNADGTWRQRRGVDAALVATVEQELRQVMAIPGATAELLEAVAESPAANVEIPGEGGETHVVAKRPPLPPKPPTPPLADSETTLPKGEPLPEGDSESPATFPQLLKFITAGKLAGKFNQAQVAAALVAIGVEGPLPVLQARPDLIPAMVGKLHAIGGV